VGYADPSSFCPRKRDILFEKSPKIVDMPQIFLPFVTEAKGQTLYETMVEGKFLLGPGPEERKI